MSSQAPVIVLGAYLALLLGIGVLGWRRSRGGEDDYYLAGRGQGTLVTALTIMATMFSSAAMLGIPGLVYRDGVSFMPFTFNLTVAGVAVWVLGSRIRRIGVRRRYVTPGDMIAGYYGGSAAVRLLAALLGFLYLLPYIVMQIKAGGHLAQRLLPGDSVHLLGIELTTYDLGTTLLSVVTVAYVLLGGMRSVAWSDVVQGLLLLSGMVLAGVATVTAMGGVTQFFERVSELPPEALSIPGVSGAHPSTKLWTMVLFTACASMIQPGQWMRYYSARSGDALRKSALVFSIVLPCCYLFGILLVALGGRALFPPHLGPEGLLPHPAVGSGAGDIDQITIVMIQEHVPALLGAFGPWAVALILVAVLAASMSTADSNLHSLSAVVTRDVYDRFVRPGASDRERTWFGRAVIVAASLAAMGLVAAGRHDPNFEPLKLISQLMFVAMAFSCQLLPVTIDMLFVRRGTRSGAVAGMLAGLVTVVVFGPASKLLLGHSVAPSLWEELGRLLDTSFIGFAVNAAVFVLVSRFTTGLDRAHVERFRADLEPHR